MGLPKYPVIRGGVSPPLEGLEVNHAGGQSCPHDPPLVKTPGTKAQVGFPVGASQCLLSHKAAGRVGAAHGTLLDGTVGVLLGDPPGASSEFVSFPCDKLCHNYDGFEEFCKSF
jgi:hypothetical protein